MSQRGVVHGNVGYPSSPPHITMPGHVGIRPSTPSKLLHQTCPFYLLLDPALCSSLKQDEPKAKKYFHKLPCCFHTSEFLWFRATGAGTAQCHEEFTLPRSYPHACDFMVPQSSHHHLVSACADVWASFVASGLIASH